MKILYISCSEAGLFTLKEMHRKGTHQISAVVTISPSIALKYSVSGYERVDLWCKQEGIPVIVLDNYQLRREDIEHTNFDVIIVNGWNRLITKEVIEAAPKGGIGIHAGHPPIGHGRSPIVWNIIYGMNNIEVYCFQLTPNADDGDILALTKVEITPHDTVRMLYEKVMYNSFELFEKAISKLSSGEKGMPQANAYSTSYPKRTPEDGHLDFAKPLHELYNFIRAQTKPYPGAFFYIGNYKVYVWSAIPFDCFSFSGRQRVPGEILAILPSGIVIQTATDPIWITDYEFYNKNSETMDIKTLNMESLIGKVITYIK